MRIFVNIASYRDKECYSTIKDLFNKAEFPDKIFVGLFNQVLPEDTECIVSEGDFSNCRIITTDSSKSQGVGWARSNTQSLWREEEFTLQIDSHSRFIDHWDTKLLDMLKSTNSAKAIISGYPAIYIPADDTQDETKEDLTSDIHAHEFDSNGLVMITSKRHSKLPETPRVSAFVAAGFIFGPSQIITDVPYDPFIYFLGEEISLAARFWTHGWNIYSPNQVIIYHDYVGKRRNRNWSDKKTWGLINKVSYMRVRHLLGSEVIENPKVLKDLNKYSLGQVRLLSDYEEFSGIDFKCRTTRTPSYFKDYDIVI